MSPPKETKVFREDLLKMKRLTWRKLNVKRPPQVFLIHQKHSLL